VPNKLVTTLQFLFIPLLPDFHWLVQVVMSFVSAYSGDKGNARLTSDLAAAAAALAPASYAALGSPLG